MNSQTKSYKRGFAYEYHSVNDLKKFPSTISWWYNWKAEPEGQIIAIY